MNTWRCKLANWHYMTTSIRNASFDLLPMSHCRSAVRFFSWRSEEANSQSKLTLSSAAAVWSSAKTHLTALLEPYSQVLCILMGTLPPDQSYCLIIIKNYRLSTNWKPPLPSSTMLQQNKILRWCWKNVNSVLQYIFSISQMNQIFGEMRIFRQTSSMCTAIKRKIVISSRSKTFRHEKAIISCMRGMASKFGNYTNQVHVIFETHIVTDPRTTGLSDWLKVKFLT